MLHWFKMLVYYNVVWFTVCLGGWKPAGVNDFFIGNVCHYNNLDLHLPRCYSCVYHHGYAVANSVISRYHTKYVIIRHQWRCSTVTWGVKPCEQQYYGQQQQHVQLPLQVMFEAILYIRTVTSLNLHNKLADTYKHYLTSCTRWYYIMWRSHDALNIINCRDRKRYSVILGLVYALVEIIQFLMFAIMLRFGAFLVSLPEQHKFHTNFIHVFV